MIHKVGIMDFKCFKKADIQLSKITACTGMNSVGKSTLIQALLFVLASADSAWFHSANTTVPLNNPPLNLGSAEQIMRAKYIDIEINDMCFKYTAEGVYCKGYINRTQIQYTAKGSSVADSSGFARKRRVEKSESTSECHTL